MLLPTAKTPPKASLSDYTVLVHSRPKAGKSEFCSHADNALFLATEPGLNALEVYQVPITSWDDFLAACGEIAAGNHPFKTIVIDTVDLASYDMFADYRRLFRLTGRRAPGKIAAELSGERLRPPCGVDHFG
jgi:hypothetical protein